jgi:hypothetical protein
MNLKNQPPIMVPPEYRVEIEKISKAALMDMVWDYAEMSKKFPRSAIDQLREHRDMVLGYRKRDRELPDREFCSPVGSISIVAKQVEKLASQIPNIGDKL